jgi:hypothetical protein
MRFGVGSEVKQIVDRMTQILFAAEIAFRRLDRGVAQQELYLLQLTTAAVAEFRTGAAQVVRGNMLQSRYLTAGLHHVPDHVLRDAFAPHFPRSADRPKDPALDDSGRCGPRLERGFGPAWNRNGADMATLADQIYSGSFRVSGQSGV